jgi:hypothetical protein
MTKYGGVAYYTARAKAVGRVGGVAPVLNLGAATVLSGDNVLIGPRNVRKQDGGGKGVEGRGDNLNLRDI